MATNNYSKGTRKRLSMGLTSINGSIVAPFFVFNTNTPLADENISCDRVDVFVPVYEKSTGSSVDTINYYVRSYGLTDSGLTSSQNYEKVTTATQTVLTNFKKSISGSTEVSIIDTASSKSVRIVADASVNKITTSSKTTIVKQGSTTKYEIFDVIDLPYQPVRFSKDTASGFVINCDTDTQTDEFQMLVVAYYYNYSINSVIAIFYEPSKYQTAQAIYTTNAMIFPFNGKTTVSLADDKLNLGQTTTSEKLLGFLYEGWLGDSVSTDIATQLTGQVTVGTTTPTDINPIFNLSTTTGGNSTPVTKYVMGKKKYFNLAFVGNTPFFTLLPEDNLQELFTPSPKPNRMYQNTHNVSFDRIDVFVPQYKKNSLGSFELKYYSKTFAYDDATDTIKSSASFSEVPPGMASVLGSLTINKKYNATSESSIDPTLTKRPGSDETARFSVEFTKVNVSPEFDCTITVLKDAIYKRFEDGQYETSGVAISFTSKDKSPQKMGSVDPLYVAVYSYDYDAQVTVVSFYEPAKFQIPVSYYRDTIAKIFPFNGRTSDVFLSENKMFTETDTVGQSYLTALRPGWTNQQGSTSFAIHSSTQNDVSGIISVGEIVIDINPIFNKPVTTGGTVTVNPNVYVTGSTVISDTIDPNSVAPTTFTFNNNDITDFVTTAMKALQSLSPRKAVKVSDNYNMDF